MTINPSEFPWLAVVQKRAKECPKGAFIGLNAHNKQTLIEWSLVSLVSPECREIKKTLVDLGCSQTIPVECAFLKAHPEAVKTDGFLKACTSMFANGSVNVDWDACYKALDTALRTIYTADISAFGEEVVKKLEHDMVLFVTAKDVVNDALLGFVSCGVTPASTLGDVKIISCVVAADQQNKGIERLMFSGVLKALPATLRLFSGVRPTNTALIDVYKQHGFHVVSTLQHDPNHPIDLSSWTLLAYDVVLKGPF